MKKTIISILGIAMLALMIATVTAQTVPCPPPEFYCRPCPGLTPGFWKHNIGVALGYSRGDYSAFRDGTKLTEAMLQGYAAVVGVTLQEAYDALTAHGYLGADMVRADMANAFNAAAGFGPFED